MGLSSIDITLTSPPHKEVFRGIEILVYKFVELCVSKNGKLTCKDL